MSNGNQNNPEIDIFGRADPDEEDIFKSAIESPLTESERTVVHGDEIDLNDEDDDEDQTMPFPTSPLNKSEPIVSSHQEDKKSINLKNGDTNKEPKDTEKDHTFQTKEPFTLTQNDHGTTLTHSVDVTCVTSDVVETKPSLESSVDLGSVTSVVSMEDTPARTDGQYIEITVTDPQKQGDGMSGFVVYRVTTKTNIPLFRRKEFAVWRRFSDFLGLQSKLADKYLKKGRIVPPAPEKNMLGSTKIKMSSGQAEAAQTGGVAPSDFIDKRRALLERYMNRTAAHAILRVDPDFRDFLEIDSDLPKATNTSAFSGAGVVRLISRFGETVNKISYKMDESDSWFEEKTQNIEALETQLRKVYGSVELLVLNRKELALATGTFAKSAAILSNNEEHTSLSRILSQLAEVEEKVEQMHYDQANSDFFLFCELLKDYIALIGSIKEVFHERMKAYQMWQHAQQTLNKKRETKARLEIQVKPDKLAQAKEDVLEWESKVERSQEEFNTISIVIKKELEQFEIGRVKEFKKVIIKYLESLLHHQQELVKYWEAFLPEFKALST